MKTIIEMTPEELYEIIGADLAIALFKGNFKSQVKHWTLAFWQAIHHPEIYKISKQHKKVNNKKGTI